LIFQDPGSVSRIQREREKKGKCGRPFSQDLIFDGWSAVDPDPVNDEITSSGSVVSRENRQLFRGEQKKLELPKPEILVSSCQ
jgi:hypothetical protein